MINNPYLRMFFTETSEHLLEKDPIPNGPSSCDVQNEPLDCEESLCDAASKTAEAFGEQTEQSSVSNQDSVTSLSQITISLTSITTGNVSDYIAIHCE